MYIHEINTSSAGAAILEKIGCFLGVLVIAAVCDFP